MTDSYIFDLRSHVTAKHGNSSEEIVGRGKNISLSQRNMSPGCCMQSVE